MASTGNVFPGTGENNSGIGATAWTNPTNVLTDNGADATCNAGASSQYLVVRNFGLAVPVGATIGGITIRVEASEHSPGNEILRAQLQNHLGALVGSVKTNTINGTGKTVYTYGGVADLWGATLTDAILNDAAFGVRLWFTTSHDVRIDFVTLAVEYVPAVVVEGGPFPGPVFPGEVFPDPIFPGSGEFPADITLALTGVSAGAVGQSAGGVFPGPIFPGGVFPGPIFPSETTPGDTGGAGTVIPSTLLVLPELPLTGAVGSVTAPSGSSASLTGVTATVISASAGGAWGDSWGTSWGDSWGGSAVVALVPSTTVALPQVTATVSVGTISVPNASQALTGNAVTVSVGSVVQSRTVVLTGVGSTAAAGSIVEVRVQALTGVSASGQVGFVTAGADALAILTGVSATASVGSVSTVLSGNQATAAVGSLVPSWVVALTGSGAIVSLGTLVKGPTLSLTGVQVAGSVGDVGRSWTVAISGVAATVSVGTLEIQPDQTDAITGVEATLAVGTVVPSTTLGTLLGVEGTGEVGTVTTTGDRDAALTGVEAPLAVGYIVAEPDRIGILTAVVGIGQVETVGVDHTQTLTGTGLTVAVGSIAANPDRTTALTGVSVTASAGSLNLGNPVVLSGVSATAAVDTVPANHFHVLTPIIGTGQVGHTPKEGDVVLTLQGLVVGIGSVGILSVGPQLPTSQYRHQVPTPILRRAPRDLIDLEKDFALMED